MNKTRILKRARDETVTVYISMPFRLHERIAGEADSRLTTSAAVIREILQDYFKWRDESDGT